MAAQIGDGFMRPALLLLLLMFSQPALSSDQVWQALQSGGVVALVRHARAPGTGDPANFQLGDCSTQRNLSEEGQRQAREIGEQFRRRQVPIEQVLSSRWCRALDTARLAFGNLVQPEPSLDSFFSGRSQEEAQSQAVRHLVESWRSKGVLVLVTHQVNITAVTGVYPGEGEMLVLRPKTGAGFDIVGRINL